VRLRRRQLQFGFDPHARAVRRRVHSLRFFRDLGGDLRAGARFVLREATMARPTLPERLTRRPVAGLTIVADGIFVVVKELKNGILRRLLGCR